MLPSTRVHDTRSESAQPAPAANVPTSNLSESFKAITPPVQRTDYGSIPSDQTPFPDTPKEPRAFPGYEETKRFISDHIGLVMLVGAQFLASIQAVITRFLAISLPEGRKYHAFEVLFARMSITLIGCLVWVWWNSVEHSPFGRKDIRWLLVARGFGGLVGVYGLYNSLTYLPMPDAVVITFLAPSVVGYACSVIPSLREPFTRAEKLGGLISLFGVTLIARPEFLLSILPGLGPPHEDGLSSKEIPAITPTQRLYAVTIALFGVLGAATAYTTIRWIGKRAHPLISVSYFAGLTTLISLVMLLLVPSTGGFMIPSGSLEWGFLAGIGVSGFAMQYLLTRGLQLTKAGKAGMIVYTQMVFALIFEWLVWSNTPDPLSIIGGGLILGSALFVNFWKTKPVREAEVKIDVRADEETGLLQGGSGPDSQGSNN